MKALQGLVNGTAPLHKSAHIDTKTHFKDIGYKEIIPNQYEDVPRQLVKKFYENEDMFSLTEHTLK